MESTIKKFAQMIDEKILDFEDGIRMISTKTGTVVSLEGKKISMKQLKISHNAYCQLQFFLNNDKDVLVQKAFVFCNYYLLCEILEGEYFSNREKIEIIFDIIKKNIYVFKRNNTNIPVLIDMHELPKIFARLGKSYMINNGIVDINTILRSGILTKEEDNILEEKMQETFKKQGKENLKIINSHQTIEKHFLDKKDSYNEKDIKFVSLALRELEVSNNIIEVIARLLRKELEKREKETKNEITKEFFKIENKFDYKTLSKEVEEFIDINTMEPKRTLEKKEEIYVLMLLTRMQVQKEQRRLFLRKSEMLQGLRSNEEYYQDNLDKFKYYEEKSGIQKELKFMEECYLGMKNCKNKEDYQLYKSYLEETLKEVKYFIPKNFSYEEEQASLLLAK